MILRTLICIPTFDNPQTIAKVVEDCLHNTDFEILIVDDGSKVSVENLLAELKCDRLHIIRFEHNRGKGIALQQGLTTAISYGFTHMLAMDGDGQHLVTEIPKLIEAARENPWDMIIGNRQLSGDSVPGISRFGRKFSNFWVDYQTGFSISDSQSGFRVYPLFHLQNMSFWTKKFDFEIEVLIRLIWKGVLIREIEVNCYYPPPDERVSHFNKLRDNIRISALNTILVTISLLRSPKTPESAGWAVGLGVLVGATPFFGFHTLMVFAIAFFFRLNAAYMWIGSHISTPPLAPFLIWASLRVGKLITQSPNSGVSSISTNWLVGSLVIGTILGLISGVTVWILTHQWKKPKPTWSGKNRGGRFGNWFLKTVALRLGLRWAYACLYFVIPYFYLFAPKARRGASEYVRITRPEAAWLKRQRLILEQLFCFAQVLIDRVFQSFHETPQFKICSNGMEQIVQPVLDRHPLILLTAHMGAWDLASALLRDDGFQGQLHVVHYESQGLTMNKVKSLENAEHLRSLPSNQQPQPILKIRELLATGKPIGLMGDRPISAHFELVPFFGRLAPFDVTPFRIAAACDAGVIFTFGFKAQGNDYDFFASPMRHYKFVAGQDKSLQCYDWVQEYVLELEKFIRRYPKQWFNFFSMWSELPFSPEISASARLRHNLREELRKQSSPVFAMESVSTPNDEQRPRP